MNKTPHTEHAFTNYRKLISLADHDWETAEAGKISGLNVEIKSANRMLDQYGRAFHHFCTTSYLGLDHHPDLLDGAMATLWETGTLRIANSKNRCKLAILDQFETELSELFGASCLSTLSCSAASAGILPLLASGVFTENRPPVMVFDRLAHYSMNHLKAACADETMVVTCPHNDMDFLETLCQRHTRVAYVADGAYSMGGVADLDSLLYLKDRYGLFLYLDDSHALSAVGTFGAGLVRPRLHALDDDCLIVASLAKSFGASGGLVMLANSIAIELANQGFFTSAVFFPVVPQGKAAIRITLRADMETTLIRHFCELISELLRTHGRDIGSANPRKIQ
ncbi:7-keto-8-aminopelargonate synthetase-like enzyme [Pseudomonas sp. GM102]|uniref:aminotransferase class I/II-fold pyridoxal phosphate-dependent enzyme n=1 Tax=Pseudomonas sp. GM102 TaxID=1144321 RepID=UPI00026F4C2C|nr:aminotransferase class I/II-fold pyridoxal phosphate-dependent enzyme [Pseudomonas sp. GM102]EJL98359.1 7-keto-8-aminopelargonate synthetase-like enzyme [Pseudomonas sp. GM102]